MAISGEGRPRFWIVAGPNGSGKSTAYGRGDVAGLDGSVWIINPDLLTVRLRNAERLGLIAANLAAVQRIETWLDSSIEVHQTIGVETVLSSSKYRRLVDKAKAHGSKSVSSSSSCVTRNCNWSASEHGSRKGGTTYRLTRCGSAASVHLSRRAGSFGKRTGPGCSTIPIVSRS